MKLWQKVYLLTLVLTILSVNIGIFILFHVTYSRMLLSEKTHCETEFFMLHQNFSENVETLQGAGKFNKTQFKQLLYAYQDSYAQDFFLQGWYQGQEVSYTDSYSKKTEEKLSNPWNTENSPLINQRDSYIYISQQPDTILYMVASVQNGANQCQIGIAKKLEEFDQTWNTLRPMYLAGSLILSVGMSLLLGILVRHLLKPIDTLTCAVKDIQAGNLKSHVEIQGKNEFAYLGTQFNQMTEKIQETMDLLDHEVKRKQQLIDNLAHEINTPITSIQGFSQYIQIGNISEEERGRGFHFINQETHRLKAISDTLLLMAKLKHTEVSMELFSFAKLCEDIKQIEQVACQQQQVQLQVSNEIPNFYGNKTLIESLIRNLLHNSLHATMPNGRIELVATMEKEEMCLMVKDTGCGMSAEEVTCMFEPFYRVDKARSRAQGGSGLGLAFCKTIVEIHNGKIKVTSEKGKGTAIRINLPFHNLSHIK